MGDTFIVNDCGQAQIALDLHPLTEDWRQAIMGERHYIPKPKELTAMNNIVLAAIIVPFPAFETDENGQYQSDDLIGRRLVAINAGNMPMDIDTQISLDPTTGIVTSIYADQTHTGTIGYFLTSLPDLMP